MENVLPLRPNKIERVSAYQSEDSIATRSNTRNSHRIYQRKQVLYCAGDVFKAVYQLRSGSAKASVCTVNGDEHITDFFYPGDIVGVDGFDSFVHSQQLTFLETSSVVCYTEREIDSLLAKSEAFRSSLLRAMSHSLVRDQQMLLSLTNCCSVQRVAQFILSLSKRFSERRCSSVEFSLSMTRTDIASYIGMAIETLSRVLTAFQQANILSIKHRKVVINDLDALRAKAKVDLFL
ncbi:helix-turn-helix domain-containing protein [Ningiella sp. W23]|uniref:helix-turn-helix domain-containing protein n=1 Tax=Ningiella sp. W23 TaxID=3023715 RepID=UPI003756738E